MRHNAPSVFGFWLLAFSLLLLAVSCQNGYKQIEERCETICVDSLTYDYHIVNSDGEYEGRLMLVQMTDTLNIIRHIRNDSVVSEWALRYPVYRFICGNLAGDEMPEIMAGVVKKTHYQKDMGRRLFIFKLHRGEFIRPLWLGSRVGQPLKDFCLEHDSITDYIHTWEHTVDGKDIEVAYVYEGFGLKFKEYLKRDNETTRQQDNEK